MLQRNVCVPIDLWQERSQHHFVALLRVARTEDGANRGWGIEALSTASEFHVGLHPRLSEMNKRAPVSVIEMNIGKWYDPISERWFAPSEAVPHTIFPQPTAERVLEIQKRSEAQRTEAQRIWELLVDCCAHR